MIASVNGYVSRLRFIVFEGGFASLLISTVVPFKVCAISQMGKWKEVLSRLTAAQD